LIRHWTQRREHGKRAWKWKHERIKSHRGALPCYQRAKTWRKNKHDLPQFGDVNSVVWYRTWLRIIDFSEPKITASVWNGCIKVSVVFWDVISRSTVELNWRFGGMYCLHLQDQRINRTTVTSKHIFAYSFLLVACVPQSSVCLLQKLFITYFSSYFHSPCILSQSYS
jgi:hypothetical protein